MSRTTERLVAPDLARGMALLGIAIANAITAWTAFSAVGGLGVINTVGDSIAALFGAMFVHVRGIALFSTLLGYGIGMIYSREMQRGNPAVRVIFRRYAWLAVFGAVHMALLFYGDIMLMYGMMGMFFCLMLHLRDKPLLLVAGISYVLCAVATTALMAGANLILGDLFAVEEEFSGSYLDQLFIGGMGVLGSPLTFMGIVFMLGPCVLVGFVAGRRGVMSNVAQYRRLLWTAALVTLAFCVLVGVPWWLFEVTGNTVGASIMSAINSGFGPITGPGFLAIFALLGDWLQRTGRAQNPVLRMVTDLGSISMTGYLLQSILFSILVMPYGLGIGQGEGAMVVSLVAAAIWFITVLIATVLRRAGVRGPFERLHRAVAYAKRG